MIPSTLTINRLTLILFMFLFVSALHTTTFVHSASIVTRFLPPFTETVTTTLAPSTKTPESRPPESPLSPQSLGAGHHSSTFSLDPEANHQVTVNKQTDILAMGHSLSLDITNTLISPFTFVNNKVSQAASTLPAFMATNGACKLIVIANLFFY